MIAILGKRMTTATKRRASYRVLALGPKLAIPLKEV